LNVLNDLNVWNVPEKKGRRPMAGGITGHRFLRWGLRLKLI
jgi:hypothetical protein